MPPTTERIKSVEIFRVLAILTVLALHVKTFTQNASPVYQFLSLSVIALSRYAVMFFFIIAGFFWGKKVRVGADPLSISLPSIRKLLSLFFWWCVIYLLPYNLGSILIYGPRGPLLEMRYRYEVSTRDPLALLLSGTQGQLWFLVTLCFAMLITAFFVRQKAFRTLIVIAAGLYILSVFGKLYGFAPLGIDIAFHTRHGPFFGLLAFASGYFLSALQPAISWSKTGTLIFALACLLQYVELVVLFKLQGPPAQYGYFFASYIGGLGAALAGLSNHPSLQNERLASLGKYTLGIYLSHFIVIENLKQLHKLSDSVWWDVAYVLFVYLLCIGLVKLLAGNKVTRKLVL